VADSFDDFRDAHHAEHQTAFNRGCVAVGNAVILLSTVPLLARRWRSSAAAFLAGTAITVVGHVAEGNLPRAARDLAQHPIWSVRADVGLARDVILRRG
jgi:hypothetical protein